MKKGKIIFKGSFQEYFLMSLGLFVLSILTCGLIFPYYFYWTFKYFFTKLEVEIYDHNTTCCSQEKKHETSLPSSNISI